MDSLKQSNNIRVSVIIPIIRPERVHECIDSILYNAGIDDYEILSEEDTERIGAPKMVKRLTDRGNGQCVCFLGDDTVAEKDFLKNALDSMATLPDGWGLVGLNDGIRQGKVAAHWLADKRLLPLLDGEFFNTQYLHCWCDNELTDRCKEMGRFVFSEKSKIIHNHPIIDLKWDDEHYHRVYADEMIIHDMLLFRKRKRNGWKNVDRKKGM